MHAENRKVTSTIRPARASSTRRRCHDAGDRHAAVATATAEIKQDAKDAAHATGTALERAGEKTEAAARDAAHATGTAMEKAGKKLQKKSKKGS